MPKLISRCLCALLLISLIACSGQVTMPAEPDYYPTQSWRSSSPEAQGFDSGMLLQILGLIRSQKLNMHSVLVIRNGYIVTEVYYPPYATDIRHTIESNTKSIIGTLIGIAIEQGKIRNVDQKLVDFFPDQTIQNLDEQKKAITLKHLLSMTAGLDCQDQTPAATGMYQTQTWVQYLLDLPMKSAPGKDWVYCSGAAHLLSAVLQKATGMDARTFANQYLFALLGIANVSEIDWGTDAQGVTNGITGLHLTPRELAKYGLLLLNKGRWEGRQVVPARWVDVSTGEQASINPEDTLGGLERSFGYLVTVFPIQKFYGFVGIAGQELFVLPKQNLIVVFNASLEVGQETILLKLTNENLRQAVKSDIPLPDNSANTAQLEKLILDASGTEQPIVTAPDIARQVSGKTYQVEQNQLGWTDITFFFEPDAVDAVIRMSGSPDYRIGLDNQFRLTEVPDGRPVGFLGRWEPGDTLWLKYITLGEFTEIEARFRFSGQEMTIILQYLNYADQYLVLKGKQK